MGLERIPGVRVEHLGGPSNISPSQECKGTRLPPYLRFLDPFLRLPPPPLTRSLQEKSDGLPTRNSGSLNEYTLQDVYISCKSLVQFFSHVARRRIEEGGVLLVICR